jgi:hypothetical protein
VTKPIKPSEAAVLKRASIPDRVIAIVNSHIAKNFDDSGRAVVKQDDIVASIRADDTLDSTRIFEDNWLDFEPLFREAGWAVVYDKPGYNENYRPYFVFTERASAPS